MPSPTQEFLEVVANPEATGLDIVAVHGLNPLNKELHASHTWTASNGKMWLKDPEFLPGKLLNARIMLLGYNSSVAFGSSIEGVREHAENLLFRLKQERRNDPLRPILFICHSLGGLVVKRALILAALNNVFFPIYRSTYGLVFFGTPHRGGNNAELGDVAAKIARVFSRSPSNSALEALKENSFFADDLRRDFELRAADFSILTFYETLPKGIAGIIVKRESAVLGVSGGKEQMLGCMADHSNICRFGDPDGEDFKPVLKSIKEMAEEAMESANRANQKEIEALSKPLRTLTLSQNVSDTSKSRAPFPKQAFPGLPPLHYAERTQLSKQLANLLSSPDPCERPRIAIVCGLGGSGKTQLVRNYVRTELDKYDGFAWMDASNLQTLHTSFHALALEIGHGEPESTTYGNTSPSTLEAKPKAIVEKTLQFIVNHPREWLLVFDNYDPLESPADERFNLRDFFPGGSCGNIIVTTRNREIVAYTGGSLLPVDFMSVPEAVSLLEKTATLPTDTAQELKAEIVSDLLSCLPLAVAQAGAYIRNSGGRKTIEARLTSYREHYKEHEATMLKGENGGQVMEYGKSVMTTWDMSFRTVFANNRNAAELLLLFGFYHYNNIPREIFQKAFEERENLTKAGIDMQAEPHSWLHEVLSPNSRGCWDPKAFEDAMQLLENYSLLHDVDGFHYTMHPLVHTWTRVHGPSHQSASIEQRAHLALSLVAEVFDSKIAQDYAEQNRIMTKFNTHVESCVRFIQQHTELFSTKEPAVLMARTLLKVRWLLSGDGLSPVNKAQRLPTKAALLGVVNGCRTAGIDDYKTIQSLRFSLESLTNDIPGTNDMYGELMHILLDLLAAACPDDFPKSRELSIRLVFRGMLGRSLMFSGKHEEGYCVVKESLRMIEESGHEMSIIANLQARVTCASILAYPNTTSECKQEAIDIFNDCILEAEDEVSDITITEMLAQTTKMSCLSALGRFSEAEEISASISEACHNAQGNKNIIMSMYFIATRHVYFSSGRLDKALEVEKLHEAWNRKVYGDFDIITMQSRLTSLSYEFNLIHPGYMNNQHILGQASEMDEMIIFPIDLTLIYKSLGRDSDIENLWPAVIEQANLEIPLKSIIRDYIFAFGVAADTADGQGYSSHAELLRKHIKDLESRTLEVERTEAIANSMEPGSAQLERLKVLFDRLNSLEREMKTPEPGRKRNSISRQILNLIQQAPPRSRNAMLFFVVKYLTWLYGCNTGSSSWIMEPRLLEKLHQFCSESFGASAFKTMQCTALVIITSHLDGDTDKAIRLEKDFIHGRKEDTRRDDLCNEAPAQTSKVSPHASVVLESLLLIYNHRAWIDWRQRLLEALFAAFVQDFGIQHSQTLLYWEMLCELYNVWARVDKSTEMMNVLSNAFETAETESLQIQIVTRVEKVCNDLIDKSYLSILFVLYHWLWEHEGILVARGTAPFPGWKRERLGALEMMCRLNGNEALADEFAAQLAELEPEVNEEGPAS